MVEKTRVKSKFFILAGADLENMVNQAALKAAIDECSTVTMEHFDFARDKVIMGRSLLSQRERERERERERVVRQCHHHG
jgi:ATP-dependent Zn protease